MPIGEFFHLIHVVDDEDEADAFYDRLFSPLRFAARRWSDIEKRWASLSMVGDLMLEVIEPSRQEAHADAPLSRFHRRFGQQPIDERSSMAADLTARGELPFSATFRVGDIDAVERHVDKLGVRVADRRESSLTLDPSDCFGAVWSFTEMALPGDPRPE